MSTPAQPIKVQLSVSDALAFERRKQAPDSMFYASGQREKERILSAALAQAGLDRRLIQWDYTEATHTLNFFPIELTPYEKEFGTCRTCHKYKGCWTDSELCSDCDEAEDERKMAANEAMEELSAARYTAPPAEHGVRDLLLGLVAALLFSGLLGSCATPARLPLQAGVKAAEHDNRTRVVEPYAAAGTRR